MCRSSGNLIQWRKSLFDTVLVYNNKNKPLLRYKFGSVYKLSFPLPKDSPHKVWLSLAKRFQRRRSLNILGTYMYIAPEQGQTTPRAQNIFININLLSICSFLAGFLPLNDIFLLFPIQMHGRPKLTFP